MNELIYGVSFQEYNLTIIRIMVFLNYLGSKHKNKTTRDRLALYDFYLKYPDLAINSNKYSDFSTKYSYFHWIPNFKFYNSILNDLIARGLINIQDGNYLITKLGIEFISSMKNKYIEQVIISSEFIITNIWKQTNQSIINQINDLVYKERGV